MASHQSTILSTALLGLALVAGGCGDGRQASTPAPAAKPSKELPKGVAMRTGADIPFEHSWDLKLPHAVRRSWISDNVPELVFFEVYEDDQIYAVDVMSGATKWVTQPLPRALNVEPYVSRVHHKGTAGQPDSNDDRLWVVSDDTLFSFDGVYGQLVWRQGLSFSASSGPMAAGEDGKESTLRVFIGDWGGHLRVITNVNLDKTNKPFTYEHWQWNLYAPITATPTIAERLVYVGDHAGVLSCFKLDRERVWSFKVGGTMGGTPLVRGRTVYAGSDQNVFYALDRLSGEQRGSIHLNAPVDRTPFAFFGEPNRLYVWTTDENTHRGGLWAIDTQGDSIEIAGIGDQERPHKREIERMSRAWFAGGATDLVATTPDHLYLLFGSDSTVVQAVNRTTGKVDWAWDLNDKSKSARPIGGKVEHILRYQDPTDQNRSIITVDKEGQVVAYRFFGYRAKDKAIASGSLPAQQPAKKPGAAKKPAEGAAAP